MKWNLAVLEPTNQLKHLSKEKSDEGSAKSARKRPTSDFSSELDTLIDELDRVSISSRDEDGSESEHPGNEAVRISIGNFDEELLSSKGTLSISASKEKLVKTQAQATQDMLTSKMRSGLQQQPETHIRNTSNSKTPKTSSKTSTLPDLPSQVISSSKPKISPRGKDGAKPAEESEKKTVWKDKAVEIVKKAKESEVSEVLIHYHMCTCMYNVL